MVSSRSYHLVFVAAMVHATVGCGGDGGPIFSDAQVDQGQGLGDKGSPKADKGTPPADKGSPKADKGAPAADKGTPAADQATPKLDQTTPTSDQATPKLDQAGPTSDQATPKLDQAGPTSDQATPKLDQTTPTSDQVVADGLTPTSHCAAVVGTFCTQDADCGGQGTVCLLWGTLVGVCTCACTQDDLSTPGINEDDCPSGPTPSTCATVSLSGGGSTDLCLQTCQPKLGANSCHAGVACAPKAQVLTTVASGVCLGGPCSNNSQCPVRNATACDTQTPGSCPAGQQCIANSGSTTAGRCAVPGVCDMPSGLCAPHPLGNTQALVGNPCQSDLDCAGNMVCEIERDLGGGVIHSRNGYCTISGCKFDTTLTQFACPTGSSCNRLYYGGVCQRNCDPANTSTCRNNPGDKYGDYECRNWENLSLVGTTIAPGPICGWGSDATCDLFPGIACDDLAPTGNPNGMLCRKSNSELTSDSADPNGTCLDASASGPISNFGDPCTQASPCPPHLRCVTFQGASDGFCTVTCSPQGGVCGGAPAGTLAACVAEIDDGQGGTLDVCGYLCGAVGQVFNCPTSMTCSTTQDPPGSGQFPCNP
jgi:hypothetical protein